MAKMLIQDLITSLEIGEEAFASLRGIEPQYDPRGKMVFTAGRESAVFKVIYQGRDYALKCYYNSQPLRAERCGYIKTHDPQGLIVHPQYFCKELWTECGVVDVALYEWVEGRSLDWCIRKALHDGSATHLTHLLANFIQLASSILDGEWRHGDLKTENIVVCPNGEMVLMDCDALYAPTLPPSGECGTPRWVHPNRGNNYDAHIDDYGIALMVVSLAALIARQRLFVGECAVAIPALGNREEITHLFSQNHNLTYLHESIYSQSHIIYNLNHNLQCIAHLLHDSTKPLL